jgi:hypothetical protein
MYFFLTIFGSPNILAFFVTAGALSNTNFPKNTCHRDPFIFISPLELFINVRTQEQLVEDLKTLHIQSDWVTPDAVPSSGRHSVVRSRTIWVVRLTASRSYD